MIVEIDPMLVAEIADSYVKAPRLACKEFQAIVLAFRALHFEFTTRGADAFSECQGDLFRLHAFIEHHLSLSNAYHGNVDHDVLSALRGQNDQEIAGSLSQHEKQQIFSKARAAYSEHCNTRVIEIAARGELFCRTIEMATMEKADPFELAGTSRLRTIVCQGLIPIGHPAWWKSVFDPDFKFVEASFRMFTDRVEYIELKARTRAGGKRKPASTPAKPTANTKPLSKADDTHHAKVLKIVAAWRQHHDKPGGYCTDPATVADVVRASGIARRTLQRVVNAMFGISKGEDTAGWARYQSMCQDQNVFLKWLDTIVKPAATLALLATSPKAEGEQCDSCGERATNLKEYADQELCPDCYSAAMGEN